MIHELRRFSPVDKASGHSPLTDRADLQRRIAPEVFKDQVVFTGVNVLEKRELLVRRRQVAHLFVGQGSQFVGMGKEFGDQSQEDFPITDPDIKAIYEVGEEIFEFPVRHVSLHGPEGLLNRTINAQPAILMYNEANRVRARKQNPKHFRKRPRFYAGHSLGQYSAYIASGALALEDACRLVKARAIGMEYASVLNPGGNIVVTLQRRDKNRPAEQNLEIFSQFVDSLDDMNELWLGIDNTPTQLVFAGTEGALRKVQERAKNEAADAVRIVRVRISTPAHSPLMEPAIPVLKKILDAVEIREPNSDIILNTTGLPTTNVELLREEILRHLTETVLWRQTLEFLEEENIEGSYEFGPGRILSNMADQVLQHRKEAAVVATALTVAGATAATFARWRQGHRK